MTSQGFGDYIRKEYELAREAAKLAGLTPVVSAASRAAIRTPS